MLLIMGATASGKSALALALARELGGEIVNADSMQAYRDLRVLTARPTPAEETRAPHHLYGHVDGGERYSAGRWLRDAMPAIEAIRRRGAVPIVAGGTGLYFRALTNGLAEMPDSEGFDAPEHAYGLLQQRDPETAAALSPNDTVRILRALKVLDATGRSIRELRADTRPALAREEWVGLALVRNPRAPLYKRIDARFDAMLGAGALDEVRALAARKLDSRLPIMTAHGVPALIAHLEGRLSLEEAAEIAKRDTRRYAKRQHTWIANQMPDWTHIDNPDLDDIKRAALAVWRAQNGGIA